MQLYQPGSGLQCRQNCVSWGDKLAKPKYRKQHRRGNHRSARTGRPNPRTAAWVGFAAYAHLGAASAKALPVPWLGGFYTSTRTAATYWLQSDLHAQECYACEQFYSCESSSCLHSYVPFHSGRKALSFTRRKNRFQAVSWHNHILL